MKIGNDESQFNASLIVRGKVVRQCPQIWDSNGRGPLICLNDTLPLGQTGPLPDLSRTRPINKKQKFVSSL